MAELYLEVAEHFLLCYKPSQQWRPIMGLAAFEDRVIVGRFPETGNVLVFGVIKTAFSNPEAITVQVNGVQSTENKLEPKQLGAIRLGQGKEAMQADIISFCSKVAVPPSERAAVIALLGGGDPDIFFIKQMERIDEEAGMIPLSKSRWGRTKGSRVA